MSIYSVILLFVSASIFVLQLYSIEMSYTRVVIIVVGAIAAGLSSLAAPPIVWVSLIAIVLNPIGVPTAPIILVLMLFEPFLQGLMGFVDTAVSCAAVSVAIIGKAEASS